MNRIVEVKDMKRENFLDHCDEICASRIADWWMQAYLAALTGAMVNQNGGRAVDSAAWAADKSVEIRFGVKVEES